MAKSDAEADTTFEDIVNESATDVSVDEKDTDTVVKADEQLENEQNNKSNISESDENDHEPAAKKICAEDAEVVVQTCKKPIAPAVINPGATFWPPEWRLNLCTCNECMDMMKISRVDFLVDPEDTMDAYELKGKSKPRDTEYDHDIRALASLDRVHQINVITAINTFKEKLAEFLQGLGESGEVMTADSVRNFFQKLKEERESQNGGGSSGGGGGGGAMF